MHKLKGLSQEEMDSCFPYTSILVGYRGSIAHGTYTPSTNPDSIDDKDVLGMTVGPANIYIGLENFEQKESMIREWDIVTYEIKKYFKLLLKSNPNIMSLLWLRENHYIYKSFFGQQIIDNRNIFASRNIYKSFTVYAYGQLHRMTHQAYNGYMGQKRKSLVDKYGFDCKNACHLIRILRMGIEFLQDGVLNVHRHDAQQLLEIKHGEWTLERVQREADRLFALADIAKTQTILPLQPDYNAANELLQKILYSYLEEQNIEQSHWSLNDRILPT